MWIRRIVVAAVGCLGVGVMSSGVAHAVPSKFSDSIGLNGVLTPGPTPGSFTFRSTTCGVHSDASEKIPEKTIYPCQGSGGVTLGRGSSGFATVTSADGTVQWKFTLTRVGATTYKMVGAGTEYDSPEGGVVPPPYPANMIGKITITGTTITMSATVTESGTQP